MINSVKRKHPPRDHAGQWQAGKTLGSKDREPIHTHTRADVHTHTRGPNAQATADVVVQTDERRASAPISVLGYQPADETVKLCAVRACVRASAHGLLVVGWARAHTHILIWCIGMCAGTHTRKMHGEQQQQNTRTRHRRNMILDV